MARRGTTLPAFVDALVSTAIQVLDRRCSIPEVEAKELGMEIAVSICDQFQKQYIYIPLFKEAELRVRDEALLKAYAEHRDDGTRPFTGQRTAKLAQEFRLTTVQVYLILKHCRSLAKKTAGAQAWPAPAS